MTREFSAVVQREGDIFVAQCLDVDVASQGATEVEALASLQQAQELYVQSPQASDAPRVNKVRVDIDAA